MEREQFGTPIPRGDERPRPAGAPGAEPSLGELFTRLSTDTGELVRKEVALARAEMREVGATLARDATKVGIAVGLALAGVLAVTAFLVVALGDLFDNYWLSALIVGALFLVVGGIMARNAVADVKRRGLTPQQTMSTLREDKAWAREEAREVKRELTR
jgi:uncharacterized membrane protein YqjE